MDANAICVAATSRAKAWKTAVVGGAFGLAGTVVWGIYFHDTWQGWAVFGLTAVSRWLNGRAFKRTVAAAYWLGRDADAE